MYNKIVVVGPNSVHVENFILLIKPYFKEIIFIGLEQPDYKFVTRSYQLNFHSLNPFALLKNRAKLKQIIKLENPDIVHVHSANRVAFMVATVMKKAKSKMVVTTWGSDVLIVPKKNVFAKKMVQFILNTASYITADSKEMIKGISELTRNKNCDYILLGIDPIDIVPKQNIVYSNRLHKPLYNIEQIIKDFEVFAQKNRDWELIIGATGPLTNELKRQAETSISKDKIKFVGWLDQKTNRTYYQQAKIYISIPKSDGTAVSLLEAMSAGCIPVVSNLEVSAEWIIDGENGIIKMNHEKDVLSRALSLDLDSVQKKNKEVIESRGTKSIASGAFMDIYNTLLSV